jgi:NAD kinase
MKFWVTGKPGAEAVSQQLLSEGHDLDETCPDFVLIWGGDGSILRTARCYPNTPLVGLRVDSVGHLAEINGEEWKYAIKKLQQQEYSIEEAPHIELVGPGFQVSGINEVYFFREYEHATRMKIFLDDQEVYGSTLFGDGCLAATPRGSTAYSWTVGRKIVLSPQDSAYVFTPLSCGFLNKLQDINNRQVARIAEQLRVEDHKNVTIEIIRGGRNKIASDGLDAMKKYIFLQQGDQLTFQKASSHTRFVRFLPSQ